MQVFSIEVEPSDSLNTLKAKIQEQTGLAPERQRIIFEGKDLTDGSKKLSDYNIQPGSTVHLLERI